MTFSDVLKIAVGAFIGLAIRELSLFLERMRKKRLSKPSWSVRWVTGDSWTLTNEGDAPALKVRLDGETCKILEYTPVDFAERDQNAFRVAERGRNAQLLITWTSSNGRSDGGTEKRYIPPAK